MKSLKLYNVLRSISCVTDRSVQDAISEVVFKDDIKHVATKEDVAKLEIKIAPLETKIEKTAKLTIMWMISTNAALFGSLAAFLSSFLK